MKTALWLAAGASIGMLAYIIFNQPGRQTVTGSDDVEDVARKASLWGSKQRITGKGVNLAGRVKETVGAAIGSDELADRGVTEQVAGAGKDAAGNVAQAVGETIHELNR